MTICDDPNTAQTVTFNYSVFIQRYPQFANLTQPLLQAYFDEATVYLNNRVGCPVRTYSRLRTMLDLLTAHIAALNAPQVAGQPNNTTAGGVAPPLVGRISSATEGSVSVSTDLTGVPGGAAWYAQTQYGLQYWTMTLPYRRARFVIGPATVPAGSPLGLGYGGGPWRQ